MIWSLQAVPPLSDTEFAQWSTLLEKRAGLYLGAQQRSFLQTQITLRMRELGVGCYSDYYRRVVDGVAGRVEWSQLIDQLVVKETMFFRHMPSIDFVKAHFQKRLPELPDNECFEVWSVGCSSGEEPYSLGVAFADVCATQEAEKRFGITGTDISRVALSVAKAGIYHERKMQLVPPEIFERYFTQVDQHQYQVASDVQKRLCFNQGNILNVSDMPAAKVDVIFCQNLLVYFRKWLREQLLNAFVERLKPGGLLVIGLGEVVNWVHPNLQRAPTDMVQAYVHL